VLDEYGVGLRVFHGFSGAAPIYDIAQDNDDRPLIALYVGDHDPSGMYMSERDLPDRLQRYGGDHVKLRRIAITATQAASLTPFDAKGSDPRHGWYVRSYGNDCWELDALDPRVLRDLVRDEIEANISDRDTWDRCRVVEKAERQSLVDVLSAWKGAA